MRVDLRNLYLTAWVDLSGGKIGKRQRSRSAYVVAGQDDLERIFLLETFGAHIITDQFIEKIFKLHEKWELRVMGFDTTGPQTMFVDQLRREARITGRTLPPIHSEPLQHEKIAHIETVIQPVCAQGRIFRLPENQCADFKTEWQAFPNAGGYLDILDCVACAIDFLLPKKPKRAQENQQVANLRAYLKNRGCTDDYIRRRVGQVFPGAEV